MTKTPERGLVRRSGPAGGGPLRGVLAVRSGDRLLPATTPDKRTADGFLRMAAHLLMRHQRSGFRSVGVISARSGEGKTTAAVNLAVCLGHTRGRAGRVLLVDGDIHGRGLTRMVCGPEVEAQGPHPMLVGTAFENVDLMTAPEPAGALTLYDPAAWSRTLHELGERYAQIVVDVPAVLDQPEGLVLRDCVEELLLVVRGGVTAKEDVEKTLASVGRRVLGVIYAGTKPGDPRR